MSSRRRAGNLGSQLVHLDARHLGREDAGILHLIRGYEGYGEDHDAQSAHPLQNTAPELESVRERVDVADTRSACRGHSAHGLEEGAGDIHVADEDKRNGADDREHNPRDDDHEEVIRAAHVVVLAATSEPSPRQAQCEAQQCGEEKRLPVAFVIEKRHSSGQQQKITFQQEQRGKDTLLHPLIPNPSSPRAHVLHSRWYSAGRGSPCAPVPVE